MKTKKLTSLLLGAALALTSTFTTLPTRPATAADSAQALYRMYNPNSGEHFYTSSSSEKTSLTTVGWRYEGIGWYAPTSGDPVYRLYNRGAGLHHYTVSATEKDHLTTVGWTLEGVGWYSDQKKTVPLYREYNPNSGQHNYTTSSAEHKNLVSAGWHDEKIAWYGVNAPAQTGFDLATVPAYSGNPYHEVNGNKPFFTASDKTTQAFETYSNLDSLGRCGVAYANICAEIEPTAPRGEIGMIKPTGWHTVKYAGIDGNYLYNRCHLIGYQLAGENANPKNLITGTRYLNVDGMLPFENKVDDYVDATKHHVLYRVTPIFEGSNLLASGVLMEAQSVEDNALSFCVYCYNVQPGITINYTDGSSSGPEFTGSNSGNNSGGSSNIGGNTGNNSSDTTNPSTPTNVTRSYVLNTRTRKFHLPTCSSVSRMSSMNRKDVTTTRSELISEGYDPCGICNP